MDWFEELGSFIKWVLIFSFVAALVIPALLFIIVVLILT